MARVTRVQKSAAEHTCGRGHVIPKGQPYMWAKPGFRASKKYRCMEHPFKPSDLATGLNATPMAAQEDALEALSALEHGDYEGLEAIVDEFRQALEDYVQEREQGLEVWENGNSMLEDLRDQAQDTLDSFDVTVEPFDEEEPDEAASREEPAEEDFESQEDFDAAHEEWTTEDEEATAEHERWEQDGSDHWEQQVSDVEDAIGSAEL